LGDISKIRHINFIGNVSKIRHIELFDTFSIPKNETVISGSALLVALGYIPENADIDILSTLEVINKLKTNSSFHIKHCDSYDLLSTFNDELEIAHKFGFMNWTYEDIKKDAIEIDGYFFMSLSKLLLFYETINRKKDEIKISIIKRLI